MLKKIIVGLMLGFFIISNCVMFCASSALSPDEITPTQPIIETQVPTTEATTAPTVEATLAPTTEPTRPPIIFVNHSYTKGLSKTEIEEQITTLYDYISYLESACQTYDEVAEEMIEEREQSPCKHCHRADWIDMYGKIIWGCDMSYCIGC